MMAEENEQGSGVARSGRWLGIAVGALVLAGLGFYVGYLVERANDTETTSPTAALSAGEIGDASIGRELFVSKGCVMCHRYEGRGGTDGPPLDFMSGRLSANDIAGMSGRIWNHVPAMKDAFSEEGVPFPTFGPGEMEDLISYLHGGGPPPDLSQAHEMGMDQKGKGRGG